MVGQVKHMLNIIYTCLEEKSGVFMWKLAYPDKPDVIVGYDVYIGKGVPNFESGETGSRLSGIRSWSYCTLAKASSKFDELVSH